VGKGNMKMPQSLPGKRGAVGRGVPSSAAPLVVEPSETTRRACNLHRRLAASDHHHHDVTFGDGRTIVQRPDIDVLFDFMYWVNGRLLDAADHLAPEQFTDPSTATTRDLRATLVHELDVEWSWRLNLRNLLMDDESELNPADFPDVTSLRERWKQDEAEMRVWLGTLSDGDLATDVASTFTRDRRPLWHYLVHILTHAAQQQADAATLLTSAGHSPGDIGFIAFLHGRDAHVTTT